MDMQKYKQSFLEASETGSRVLILKAGEQCDCFNPKELLNSEPNPKCGKCFGTGTTRTLIYTTKIRHDSDSDNSQKHYERLDLNKSINDFRCFFMPETYKHINTMDLIATLDDEERNINSIYRVVSKEKFKANDFVFYEVIGERINYTSEVSIDDR